MSLLLLPLDVSPMIGLALIAIVDQEGEGTSQSDDDEAFDDTLVDIVIELVRRERAGKFVFVRGGVVRVLVLEKVGDPFANRKVGFGIC